MLRQRAAWLWTPLLWRKVAAGAQRQLWAQALHWVVKSPQAHWPSTIQSAPASHEGLEESLGASFEESLGEGLEDSLGEGLEESLEETPEQGLVEGLEQGLVEGLEKGLDGGLECAELE